VSVSWNRNYKPGEILKYEMEGSNQGWKYQIQATDRVKQDAAGSFYEEISWSDLHSNAPMTLSPSDLSFRQNLSLDGTGKYIGIPDLSKVQPMLIGPITDTLTLYSDLLIAKKMKLEHVGQHAYFEHGKPNSWADGQHVLLGEDAIDFDLTLVDANAETHTVTILTRHVPPRHQQVKLPAAWMQTPVSDTENNWVEVSRTGDKYTAQVGKETFDVRVILDTRDGKILSARLDNPVVAVSRECEDAALARCGPSMPETIHREVTFRLLP